MRGGETILLIDDEELVISVCKKMLEALGYRVLAATSGKQAVEVFRANRQGIDLVILDMIMPDMSGQRTHAAIRTIDSRARVLLASGYALDGEAAKIMDLGFSGFIQKPYSVRALSQKVREILGKKR